MKNRIRTVSVKLCSLLALLILSGCAATTAVKKVDVLEGELTTANVLLMPMDVELGILTAAGLMEPQAEWTSNAAGFMETSLNRQFTAAGHQLQVLKDPAQDPASNSYQLEKLHQALGVSILTHHVGLLKLPTKRGAVFDWTLGEKARELKSQTGADYALFVFVRDSYSSGGRVAMQFGMALLGVGIPGGQQLGFASLVDLESGNIIWFNHLARGTGDLRKQEAADKTMAVLMANFPGFSPEAVE